MTAGSRIQTRIAAGLARAGTRTGTGPYICTIRRASSEPDEPQNPWGEPADPANEPTLFAVTGIKAETTSRYMDGSLIGEMRRVVTVDATGVRPLKSDKVAVGIAPSGVTGDTLFEEIIEIETLEPTDTPFMYGIHLAI